MKFCIGNASEKLLPSQKIQCGFNLTFTYPFLAFVIASKTCMGNIISLFVSYYIS